MKQTIYVIGGGVIGLLCARELLRSGRQVVVLDRQQVGREASWAGGGILAPLYPWRYPRAVKLLAGWSQSEYPTLQSELLRETGIDCEWIPSGMLNLDVNNGKNVGISSESAPISIERVNSDKIRELEPALDPPPEGAYWLPEVAQVRNPRFIAAVRQDLLQKGARILENIPVTGFVHAHGRLQAVRTATGEFAASECILAAGAWSGALLQGVGLDLPVYPVRGQMLLYRGEPGMLRRIVVKNYHYLIPRRDGRVLAGSTMEEAGFDKSTTQQAKRELEEAAFRLAPALARCPMERHWAGLRPGVPDGIPFMDVHPEIAGLYVCAGHHRNGFAMAPASARFCVDLMLGRECIFKPEPYRVDRPKV